MYTMCHTNCKISNYVTNYAVIFANKLRSPMTHVRGILKNEKITDSECAIANTIPHHGDYRL